MIAICAAVLFCAPQPYEVFDSRDPKDRNNLLQLYGGTKETEAAMEKALEWLARNQRADHSWPVEDKSFTVGVTALSVLAFLGAGHHPKSETYGDSVRRGLQFLLAEQDPEGFIGGRGAKSMYHHILATTALAEAHAMALRGSYGPPAQKAVDFLVAAQTPGKGWRYSARCGESDTSVTGWAVMALKCAERAMLSFPKKTYVSALSWFNEATDKDGRTGYKGSLPEPPLPGVGEPFDSHESMTAIAVLGRGYMQKIRSDKWIIAGLDRIPKDPPLWGRNSVDYIYWHIGTRVLFEIGGSDGARWKAWNAALQKALLGSQTKEGPQAGSWETMDHWCGGGGRACATALNALTLQTYYRYLLRFGSADEK